MGVASSPAPQRPQPTRRSIRFTFLAMVITPVLCLVIFWGLTVGFTSSGALIRRGLLSHGHPQLAEIAVQTGAGVIVVLASAVLMGRFARQLRREISGLEVTARHLANVELPQLMSSLRGGGEPTAGQDIEVPATKITEIAQVAGAITSLRHTAVAAAADEARLRDGIAQVFVSLARRNQSLLQRQLHLIDALEQKATDPAALSDLFSLDHMTTRMRRHAENLIILSGSSPGRSWSDPVPVIDVIRGAMAEVEDYQRVRAVTRSQDAVTGSAVADMVHLLAELIENATLFSPSGTQVEVRAERVANGFVIEVEDRGLGIQPDLLAELNQKLVKSADFDLADPDRLGLFVVAKLATRHNIRVTLNPSPYGGTTAVMLVPHNVVVPVEAARTAITAAAEPAAAGASPDVAALAGWSDDVVALSGPMPALPASAEPPPGQTWSAPTVAGSTGENLLPRRAAGAPLSGPGSGSDDPFAGRGGENLLPRRNADGPFADRTTGYPLPHRGWDEGEPGRGSAGPVPGWNTTGPLSAGGLGDAFAGSGADTPLARRTADDLLASRGADDLLASRSADDLLARRSADDLLASRGADDLLASRGADDLLASRGADEREPGPGGDSGPPSAAGEPAGGETPQAGRVSSFLGRRPASQRDSGAGAGKGRAGPGTAADKSTGAGAGESPVGGRISAFLSGRPSTASRPPATPAEDDAPAGGGTGSGSGPPAPAVGKAAGAPAGATYRGLPRRVRQANLSPHLRGAGPAATSALPATPGPAPAGERSPERARDFVASFRSGWQRELPDDPDTQPGRGEAEPGPGEGSTPSPPAVQDTGTQQQTSGGPQSAAQHREESPWTSARPDPEQT